MKRRIHTQKSRAGVKLVYNIINYFNTADTPPRRGPKVHILYLLIDVIQSVSTVLVENFSFGFIEAQ